MSSTGLRQRKGGITGFVQNLDGFSKVVDDVKEEKRATAGLISFISFAVIAVLVCGEVKNYFYGHKQYDYRFTVDTDLHETPPLKMDFIVATPCNALSVATTNDLGGDNRNLLQEQIVKDPTRFDFSDEEQMYWTVLRHAHARMNSEGFRGLEDLEYVSDDVEEKLSHLADEKQAEEQVKIENEVAQRKAKGESGGGEIVFMVASGMGMFQMVATSSKDEGTACRIHGKLDVKKGKNEKILVSLSGGFPFHGHGHAEEGKVRNISHRIEQFNFGPRVTGLVSPLAGAEQISTGGHDVYRYFLKIVPTKIFHGIFGRYTLTYQYSVTFLKKQQDSSYSEGGIYFEYEFSATVIEIREKIKTIFHLLVRLCSIIGGVFATSQIINSLVQSCLYLVHRDAQPTHPPQSPPLTQSERASLLSNNILVH